MAAEPGTLLVLDTLVDDDLRVVNELLGQQQTEQANLIRRLRAELGVLRQANADRRKAFSLLAGRGDLRAQDRVQLESDFVRFAFTLEDRLRVTRARSAGETPISQSQPADAHAAGQALMARVAQGSALQQWTSNALTRISE